MTRTVVILTGDELRHRYFRRRIAGDERFEVVASICESDAKSLRSRVAGDEVTIHITNVETAEDQTHGFTIDMYNVNVSLEPGKHENITFKADMAGTYPMYCTEFCSALHLEMQGWLLVS